MAENITYIPYGQNEISQQDLMTNLANGLPSFMQQYKWLQKPKNQEKFLKAYDDITKNLTGATDSTGRWIINVNNIDIDGMSPKDKEIYEHAAYYVQQQMSQMAPRVKEEEKKKEDLTPFNFTTDFNKYLLRGYGNSGEIFADPEQGWDAQDARGSNGLRATTNRRRAMQNALKEYMNSLEEGKYNFEGTQFTDLNDAKAKIQTAINALNTEEESDDLPAFSALGLKYRSYFSNGGNDPYTKGDYTGTYQGYNDYLAQQEQAKQKAEQEKLKAQKANQYNNYRYYNFLNGTPSTSQDFEGIITKLSNQQALDGNDLSRISYAFRQAEKIGGLQNLSKEELAKMPRYASTPNRLKKINKLDGIYYDTFSKRLIQPQKNAQQQEETLQSILDKSDPNKKKEQAKLAEKMAQDKYLANTEWTADQTRELVGIAADVASVIDPEPFSAAGLALTGTGLRTWNRIFDADGFTLSDFGHTLLDTGMSALGAIPIVGDAALTARILGKLQKASGWIGAIFAAGSVPQAAKAAWDKVVNGKDLSVDDWRAIGNVIMGATQARRMQLNNAAGKTLQQGKIGDNSLPRAKYIAKHNTTESWNIKQREGNDIKGPWYKKAWEYFKNPYNPKPVETPKENPKPKMENNSKSKIKEVQERISKMRERAKKYTEKLKGKKVKKDENGGILDNIIEDFINNNNI